jgi:hypothetical protein
MPLDRCPVGDYGRLTKLKMVASQPRSRPLRRALIVSNSKAFLIIPACDGMLGLSVHLWCGLRHYCSNRLNPRDSSQSTRMARRCCLK